METIAALTAVLPVIAVDAYNLRPALASAALSLSFFWAVQPSSHNLTMLQFTVAIFAAFLVLPDEVAFTGILFSGLLVAAAERYIRSKESKSD